MAHLFVDESLETVEIKSSWKKERSVAYGSSQTRDIHTADSEVQSYEATSQKVQTDLSSDFGFMNLDDSENKALAAFLLHVEPLVVKCLSRNLKSRAFDGISDPNDKVSEAVTCVHTLSKTDYNKQFQVTSLSWNSTGSTLSATYGRFDHEDWCTHAGSLCTWNLDRRSINEEKPDLVIDSPCCVMCAEFHPVNPAWIAGGNFNGEIILWDLSLEDDLVLATSGIGDDAHREPVNKIYWVKGQSSKKKDYNIVSVSGDGKILIWKVDMKRGKLKLYKGFVLMSQDLPRAMKVKGVRGDKEIGVTSISFSHEDPDLFVLGSESGCVFKCNMHAKGRPAGSHVVSSVPLCSPVTFSYSPHHGPVHSVDCSKFHRNAFLSAGMDQSLHLYNLLQNQPILTIEPGDGYLYSAKWSPTRPAVLAVISERGHLILYDLLHGQIVPAFKLQASPNMVPVYSLQFNLQQKQILATGDGEGYIRVFRLGETLTSMSSRENEVLEEIMNTSAE
ncbi:cytoplasmic dynein 2 intermediate chain 2-like [Physella acuta]|uniref:cytoplasmic dynein 2 intermediate chain 2-like n=1 Tax=Physella acuta TaxID=109671 RepID=UPI0027DCFA3C|nr:cytoplasmic dynein 2 intermediate chain 2-like [Physella acuta]